MCDALQRCVQNPPGSLVCGALIRDASYVGARESRSGMGPVEEYTTVPLSYENPGQMAMEWDICPTLKLRRL